MASSGLDTHTDWLFTLTEAKELAQQHSEGGIRQLYWRLKATLAGPKSPRHEPEMVDYLLATRAAQMFPSEQDSAGLAACAGIVRTPLRCINIQTAPSLRRAVPGAARLRRRGVVRHR